MTLRIRLDTAQAEADLKRLRSEIGAAAVVAGRMDGGGRGPGGGGGGLGGGLNIGGMLSAATGVGLLGAFGGADLARGVGSIASGIGSTFSEARGFADFRRRARVPGDAARATVDQLGIAGNVVSESQAKALYRFNSDLMDLQAGAETRVRGLVGGDIAKSYEERLAQLVDLVLDNWTIILAGFVAMRAGGGLTGAVAGFAAMAAGEAIQSAVK